MSGRKFKVGDKIAMSQQEKKYDKSGIRVAVYGSLRKGLGNHHRIDPEKVDSVFLGETTLAPSMNFKMVSLGGFPACVRDVGHGTPITVEVYRVSAEVLDSLDALEGHPDWYCREKIGTPYKNAWIYLMPEGKNYEHRPAVPNGDWLDYITASRKQA